MRTHALGGGVLTLSLPSLSTPSPPPPPPPSLRGHSQYAEGGVVFGPSSDAEAKTSAIYICRMSSSSLEGWGRGGYIGYIYIRILHTSDSPPPPPPPIIQNSSSFPLLPPPLLPGSLLLPFPGKYLQLVQLLGT